MRQLTGWFASPRHNPAACKRRWTAALLLAEWVLVGYGACVFLAVYAFVGLYEEPRLARTDGTEYDAYRRAVPGWLPSLKR